MSAEVLRRAAEAMRSDWEIARDMTGITLTDPHWRRAKTWLAVADWLDHAGEVAEEVESAGLTPGGPQLRPALAVARAYLGAES